MTSRGIDRWCPSDGLESVRAGQLRIIFAVDDGRRRVMVIAVGRRRAQERRDVCEDTTKRLDHGGPNAALEDR